MKTNTFIYLMISLFLPTLLNAADKKPVGIDFFKEVKMISNMKEHNNQIYFVIKQADVESNNYRSNLYQLVDGEAKQLTSTNDVGGYEILDNGAIFFRSVRSAKDKERMAKGEPLTVYQIMYPGIGEAVEWLRLPYSVGDLKLIDEKHFFFTAREDLRFAEYISDNDNNIEAALKEKEKNKSYRVFEEIPFWSNGGGDVSGKRSHLFYYNDGEITPLSDDKEAVGGLALSPDKKTLLYTSSVNEGKAPLANKMMKIDVATLDKKEISPLKVDARYGAITFVTPDEAIFTGSTQFYKIGNSSFYKLDMITGDSKMIYSGNPYGLGSSVGSDVKSGGGGSPIKVGDGGFYYVTTVVDHSPIAFCDYNGNISIVSKGKEMTLDYVPYNDGFLTVSMIGDKASEIYFMDKAGSMNQLTSLNDNLLSEYSISTPEEFSFKNENGIEIGGFMIKPIDFESGKKYPTILSIHGGPKTVFGPHLFHEMQYWAAQGYVVIFTNPTGGDGRGNQFADIQGKYGTVDYRDLMKFVDVAIQKYPFIDADKMGVTGGSYGGFMTNWIIGHTNRFKAAASQRGIASWISFSNTTDIGYTFIHSQIGGDAWKNHDKLWKQSPLKYADNVQTPTLFIHSDEDYRCWMSEAIQMFYALKYFDVPARLCLFRGENHELSRSGKPLNRIQRIQEITDWMDSYLK